MTAVDTNVIVSLLVQDDPPQAKAVADWFEQQQDEVWLSIVVICEVVWVLGRAYKFPRGEIVVALRALLDADGLRIEHRDLVGRAVTLYEDGSADFADGLIGLRHLGAGATHTMTFDHKAAKLPGFKLFAPEIPSE